MLRHRILNYIIDTIRLPGGRGARRAVAGIMIIMALGRLGLYRTASLANLLSDIQYGMLLLILGILIWINGRFRLSIWGRILASLGALLMATMAWDVGTIGVTMLLEAWLALILLKEAFTSHDC